MNEHTVCYVDAGKYHVAITTDGIDRRPVGPAFDSPREAIRYADRLEARLNG